MSRLVNRLLGILLAGMLSLVSVNSLAAGPKHIAISDRSLWPYRTDTDKGFDLASRAEILAFAHTFNAENRPRDPAAWATWLGIKSADPTSIHRWMLQTEKLLVVNFSKASENCRRDRALFCPRPNLSNWAELVTYAKTAWPLLPKRLLKWAHAQQKFYQTYLYEQLRLAALFPRITSEILKLDNSEILGTDYPDKSFLLTFDDGPTHYKGNTDKLIPILRKLRLNGVFFIVGKRLNERLAYQSVSHLKRLYAGMCIASHGYIHVPHPKLATWRESIENTKKILTTILPAGQHAIKYFRPPYGQRTEEISNFVVKHGMRDMFWNIDSQDWNAHVLADQVPGRVESLMLLWRHGIILFHDIHWKVQKAFPVILKAFGNAGIHFINCR